MELDFKLRYNLDPNPYIEYVCCKAFKTLGFVMMLDNEFKLDVSIKIVYCALVCPILEYSYVV